MMTTEELYTIIRTQQEEIEKLQANFKALKEWSDLNDYWLREMIDALTESVDGIVDDHCCCERYKVTHGNRKARELLEKQNREDA